MFKKPGMSATLSAGAAGAAGFAWPAPPCTRLRESQALLKRGAQACPKHYPHLSKWVIYFNLLHSLNKMMFNVLLRGLLICK